MAMMQVLIYVDCCLRHAGVRDYGRSFLGQIDRLRWSGSNFLLASGTCIAGFVLWPRHCSAPNGQRPNGLAFSMQHLGTAFLHEFMLAFELISVVLLIAILGAIIIARPPQENDFMMPSDHPDNLPDHQGLHALCWPVRHDQIIAPLIGMC